MMPTGGIEAVQTGKNDALMKVAGRGCSVFNVVRTLKIYGRHPIMGIFFYVEFFRYTFKLGYANRRSDIISAAGVSGG